MLLVTDANGCTDTASFTITEPDELVATGTISNNNGFGISCNGANDGSIDLSVTGGTPRLHICMDKRLGIILTLQLRRC